MKCPAAIAAAVAAIAISDSSPYTVAVRLQPVKPR
jgi:hypothetical protein